MKEKSRLIFIKHLDTNARQVRDGSKDTEEAQGLSEIFANDDLSQAQIDEAYRLGTALNKKYPKLPRFSKIPILPGQETIGREIGDALMSLIKRQGGKLTTWEVSPLLRTRQTSSLLRKGRRHLPRERKNRRFREISRGVAERYPSNISYLATHPGQLAKYLKDRKGYVYPGGENDEMSAQRVGKTAERFERKRRYRKTTVIITHEKFMREMIKQLTGVKVGRIFPGTATVVAAEPKKGWFGKRDYHLEGEAGQDLRHLTN